MNKRRFTAGVVIIVLLFLTAISIAIRQIRPSPKSTPASNAQALSSQPARVSNAPGADVPRPSTSQNLTPIKKFTAWTDAYVAGTADLAEGQALAQARRQFMAGLIRTDP